MAIRTVMFDFGGVFTASPFTAFEAMGAELGAKPGQVNEIIFGSYAIDGDHPWHRLERGEISLEQARTLIMQQGERDHGIALDIYQLFSKMPRDGGLRHVLVERVAQLKADGYATAIITNNVKEFSDGWRSLLPVDELFDLVVDSCMEGVRKPNSEIFKIALSRLGDIDPEHTLFLDDYEANVKAAANLGINTVHVTENMDKVIADLNRWLTP
ncbi:HAD family phosphatase [Oceanicoccus sp. KOV_DT_Chl]|uniref:HAD family hydrolase n=1 Tax=Oceanicoccus sp. KOV_DT_Chl TaxID=1904639 RepID=UPI000C7B8A36|nr:HAD family phosphatase [Oceanicoccus sp. KOV_DT_Chl]